MFCCAFYSAFCFRMRLNPSHAPVTGTYDYAGYAEVGPANKVGKANNMFGSTILDVAIAIVFIYLLVSLVISAINEFIASLLKSRAKNLSKGIHALLQDPSQAGWVARLYQHPLIQSLSPPNSKPSYIPSRTFALALLDLIAPATADGARTLADLKTGMANLPQPLQRTLTNLLDEAQHDVERLKTQIEIWFNNGMDRASGWYKRKTQWIQFFLGLSLVILLNIDSVHIGRTLFAVNSPLRASLVESAKSFVAQPGGTNRPMKDVVEAISTASLPIGWSELPRRDQWLTMILGWLITAFAVSLGAPFWFDLLNKFVNVRASGKAPEEEPKPPKEVPAPKEPGG